MQNYLRSVFIAFLMGGFSVSVLPQDISYASAVTEYHPAPGQFINLPLTGTPAAAEGISGKTGSPVSLGGYGGFIVFSFDKTVKNNPAHPFGIDFIIAGNAMVNSSEQGIVMVMKDDNKNGLPDDTWYEIKGSDHFLPGFRQNYKIRYDNPKENTDIPWSDNLFASGKIRANPFNTQPYFPSSENFPLLNPDSLVFSGSLLPGKVKEINGVIVSERSYFGYADNTPFRELSPPVIPDNPYTSEIEGWGGDGIDISWAVQNNGEYADLDEIHFVKVYTGVNQDAGLLGEISTEISGIVLTSPLDGISGPLKMIMPVNIPASMPLGSAVSPEVIAFYMGRPLHNASVIWESSAPDIANFNNGILSSKNTGTTILMAKMESDPSVFYQTVVRVFKPSELRVQDKIIALRLGEERKVKFQVFDDVDERVTYSDIQWAINNPEFIEVVNASGNDEIIIKGVAEGPAYLDIFPTGYEMLAARIMVNVYSPLEEVSCFFTMRNINEVIIPRKAILSSNTDFSHRIDRKPSDYILPTGFVSLASVINEALSFNGFGDAANTFRFRMDEKSDSALYLWQFARDWEFTYGWGGSSEGGAFNACWAASINGVVYLNGFDKIPVKTGDIVSLNYVKDITTSFSELIILESDSNKKSGITRSFCALKYIHTSDGNEGFNTIKSPFSHEKILIISKDGNVHDAIFTEGDGDFTVIFENPGIYRLLAEEYPGEEIIVFAGVTGTETFKGSEVINIFPNPVLDEMNIRIDHPGNHKYEIADMAGMKVRNGMIQGEEENMINVGDLSAGVYFIRIRCGDIIYISRFIK
jgi:hypothetical protein